MTPERFADRIDAGEVLAAHLLEQGWAERSPLIMSLPRGGVEVAAPVARVLDAELDVLVVRKVGAPGHDEYAIGAVGETGHAIRNEEALRRMGIDEPRWEQLVSQEREEVRRRVEAYRGDRPAPVIEGRNVIVVDDGIATGASAAVALRMLRSQHPLHLVMAAPVGPPSAIEDLSVHADEVIVLQQPADFMAVGMHYRHFAQTTDETVLELLRAAAA